MSVISAFLFDNGNSFLLRENIVYLILLDLRLPDLEGTNLLVEAKEQLKETIKILF